MMTALPTSFAVDTARPQKKRVTKEHLESEMETAIFKYTWRKMEVAAQDTTGWREVVCSLHLSQINSSCVNFVDL